MILDVSKPKTVSLLEQQIGNLYVTAKEYPQIQCKEKHHFGPNIYIKEVTMPAGSLIIGNGNFASFLHSANAWQITI